jgi:hypothetical protein
MYGGGPFGGGMAGGMYGGGPFGGGMYGGGMYGGGPFGGGMYGGAMYGGNPYAMQAAQNYQNGMVELNGLYYQYGVLVNRIQYVQSALSSGGYLGFSGAANFGASFGASYNGAYGVPSSSPFPGGGGTVPTGTMSSGVPSTR